MTQDELTSSDIGHYVGHHYCNEEKDEDEEGRTREKPGVVALFKVAHEEGGHISNFKS